MKIIPKFLYIYTLVPFIAIPTSQGWRSTCLSSLSLSLQRQNSLSLSLSPTICCHCVGKRKTRSEYKLMERKEMKQKKNISFSSIFMHADRFDMLLMGLGLVGAISDGVSLPLTYLIASKIMNSFGNSDDFLSENFINSVNKVSSSIWFLLLISLFFLFNVKFFRVFLRLVYLSS